MPLSWNEIRHNAIRFAKEWQRSTSESADKQTFWNEFFGVFGIPRKTVASFEVPVLKTSGNFGKIDLLWKGVLLVEHKSAGEDLGKAKTQAFDYIQAMAAEGRHKEIPRYVVVSDFANLVLHDLEEDTRATFPLTQFHQRIHAFAFIPGYKQHKFKEEDPINIEAAEILAQLHDSLEAGGFSGHDLERFLVRTLFCLFAEDTGLFPRCAFELYLEENAFVDMVNIGPCLEHLFQVLNTPVDERQKNLSTTLQEFPYVNGDLFAERLAWADFGDDARQALRRCCGFDWSQISPAIFGSLFQAVMEPKERRQIGGHYTSERDILKVIRSLFLDELHAEFDSIKADRSSRRTGRLREFHAKLCRLKFLDPACGCGNFLVITYRELRQLELAVLQELHKGQRELTLDEINRLSQVDVDQFYGIEIGEWPARIAEVALWLMDHQMNIKVSEAFGQLYQRLPLKKAPHIHCGNALRLDWKQVLPPAQCSYVLGNPPFIGKQFQSTEQKQDMELICGKVKGAGVLDYVTGWYFKAAEYIKGTRIVVGFVSTNSITQGEQVGVLWKPLFQKHGIKIHFGHRTFAWESEARGKAHVHVVIMGFACFDTPTKRIYEYESSPTGTVLSVRNVNPYLIESGDFWLEKRGTPLGKVEPMLYGSKPVDGGHLLLDAEERSELLTKAPDARKFIRKFVGSVEFINGIDRWCIWLKDVNPAEWRDISPIKARVAAVREFRSESTKEKTVEQADTPTVFGEIRQPTSDYLVVPEVSSERRRYIPIAYMSGDVIASNLVYTVAGASPFTFGILTSAMHMAWMRQVCGRLKSDYRYSAGLVYNNYPWPENVSEKQRAAVEAAAQKVLSVRAEFLASVAADVSPRQTKTKKSAALSPTQPPTKTATLADLYDPLTMPPALVKAHADLDRAVDRCYRNEPFTSERQRVEFLFALYEKITAPLIAAAKPKRSRRRETVYPLHPPAPPPPQHPGPNPDQAAMDAAHFYSAKEDAPPYRTD